jgi:hypothetical protein
MRVRFIQRLVYGLLLALPVAASAQGTGDLGTLSITARPANAEIYVDGERWVSPDTTTALAIQLVPGQHRVEVRAPGFRPYSSLIDVHRGETTPLNVILPNGPSAPPPFSQAPPQPAGPYPGPGPIQQVSRKPSDDGFVFAPDFKVTEMNHRTTGFAGFYGGVVFAGQVMLGGGAYFQLDDYNSEQMAYGGFVGEYRLFHDKPVGLTIHGLAGFGATNVGFYGHGHYPNPYNNGYYGGCYGCGYPYDGFFVGEPEAHFVAKLGNTGRFVAGAGYRWTTSNYYDLNGWTASFAVQFGK